ncbi:MAG: hypothetical protein EXR69_13210 [Myxococcales bacterium]|nr:hypothetical protein [Myxococcales bacterium]
MAAGRVTGQERLVAAALALKARDWQAALDQLDPLGRQQGGERGGESCGEPGDELSAPGELARLHAFRAQALDGLDRPVAAERAAAEAVRWAKKEPGRPGVVVIQALHARLLTAIAAAEATRRAREADAALAGRTDDHLAAEPESPALLVRKANVLIDLGRLEEARVTAFRAWRLPDNTPRDQVLAALTLARCPDERAGEVDASPGGSTAADWVTRAHVIADRAEDQNLMTAVAKAARAAGVRLGLISQRD